jgi:hypothetical protein
MGGFWGDERIEKRGGEKTEDRGFTENVINR